MFARSKITEALRPLTAGVENVEVKIVEGHSARTIINFAHEQEKDCIVIASHRPAFRIFSLVLPRPLSCGTHNAPYMSSVNRVKILCQSILTRLTDDMYGALCVPHDRGRGRTKENILNAGR